MDINRVFISGMLTRDPEIFYNSSNNPLTRMNIMVVNQNRVNFFDVVVYSKLAEVCKEKLTKDSKIIVEGKLKFSNFFLKSGEHRTKIEIIGETINFIERGGKLNVK